MLEGHLYERITTAQIHLQEVKAANAETAKAARTDLEEVVRAAKSSGASWSEIGRMFGISKQAAQKRFGNDEKRPTR